MYPKPGHLFDRDREWAALTRFVADPGSHATLGIVSGRRRQGKTFLLSALTESVGGLYFAATEATLEDSLRLFGEAIGQQTGAGGALRFDNWDAAVSHVLRFAVDQPRVLVLDEFPYLMRAMPSLPSLLQRELDSPAQARHRSRLRLLLCGSAMSVMGGLLAGTAPLRGRAGLELVVHPLSYADAAKFWGITDPHLAILVNSIVGGTPAYRRQFVRDDAPRDLADFDDWVCRTVLEPTTPLFREARYLLAEEPDIRDPGLYHSVLAAVATGNRTAGGIASYVGRKSNEIAHPLAVLEDCGLVIKEADALTRGRSQYRIAEPLVTFYHSIMRSAWSRLELGLAADVWRESAQKFRSQVVGPHFEQLCRTFATVTPIFGTPAHVAAGVVTDPAARSQIEVDVVVFAESGPGQPRRVQCLGEAKWGKVMTLGHLERLRRARDLLAAKGFDVSETGFACFAGAGFEPALKAVARADPSVRLLGPEDLYQPRQ